MNSFQNSSGNMLNQFGSNAHFLMDNFIQIRIAYGIFQRIGFGGFPDIRMNFQIGNKIRSDEIFFRNCTVICKYFYTLQQNF